MKKILISLLIILQIFAICGSAEEPNIKSEAAILIDADTGQILYEKNKDEQLYPASITKIMTLYMAAVYNMPEKMLVASEEAIKAVPNDTSNIALDYGEEVTMEQAMYAAMLMSANDACNVLAEEVSGSIPEFAKLMTKTAGEFGAKNTNFVNANGLSDPDHYTTAYDFAQITRNAIKNPEFMRVFTALEYTIPPTNKKSISRNFYAQHRMMHQAQYADCGVVGGKAGYTTESQHTLVTYGEGNGHKLIAVTLKNPDFNGIYKDTEALLKFGYENFERVQIPDFQVPTKVEGRTTWTPQGSITCLLRKGETVEQLTFDYGDEEVKIFSPRQEYLGSMSVSKVTTTPWWRIVLRVIGIIIVVLLGIVIIFYMLLILNSNKGKRRKRRIRRRR